MYKMSICDVAECKACEACFPPKDITCTWVKEGRFPPEDPCHPCNLCAPAILYMKGVSFCDVPECKPCSICFESEVADCSGGDEALESRTETFHGVDVHMFPGLGKRCGAYGEGKG